jgi:cardiolipin synthase A/B
MPRRMLTTPIAFHERNAIALLRNGEEFFPALEAEMDQATSDILVETYIFIDDDEGKRFEAAFMRALARGVRVRLMIDGIGSREYVKAHAARLRVAGVEVLIYRRDKALLRLARSRMRRSHRKVQIIDGRVAFIGGINIVSDFAPPNRDVAQYDYAVRIEGPLVNEIAANASKLWRTVALSSFQRKGKNVDVPPVSVATGAGSACAAFVFRDNFRHRRDIERAYLRAVMQAKEEIILACAYFFPGRLFRTALLNAAARGVKVHLLLQGHTDHRLLQLATHAMYADLLHGGIEISEYTPSMLHAKVAVVDAHWATVGSSNLDPFSLVLNRESNVVIENEAFAQQLRVSLQTAIRTQSKPVPLAQWVVRGWQARIVSWLAYKTARLVLAISGFARG